MNMTIAMQGANAIETQMNADAELINKLDALMQVETLAGATKLFSSDCCGSNNYPE